MGWWKDFLDSFMKSDASSTSNSSRFAVDCTEPLLLTVDEPHELTVGDLNKATKSFSAARLIAHGRNVKVYKAVLPSGTVAAAKRLGTPHSGNWSASEDAFLRRHVSKLSTQRHDNLVRLLGYTITDDLRVLLFEFATVGTLREALHGPTTEEEPQPGRSSRPALTLSWAQRVRIALDVARRLEYLHEVAAVSHRGRGVRSSKVLLFQGLRAKIADYDVLEQLWPDEHCRMEDCMYFSPESFAYGREITYKADVYSLGIVLLELLTGRTPHNMRHMRLRGRPRGLVVVWATTIVTKRRVEQWIDPKLGTQYRASEARKLGRIAIKCLHNDPESRPSMGDVAQAISIVIGNYRMAMAWRLYWGLN